MLKHLKRSCPNCPNLRTHHHCHTNTATQSILEQQDPNVPPFKPKVPHPWPEWSALMAKLLKFGYFQENEHPFGTSEFCIKDVNRINKAFINFARDRYQLLRYLSPKHIFHLVGSGCPNTDRKIVNSSKRLRAHFDIDESNVCGPCILRGNCERAFLRPNEGEGGRTVDVMRLLVTYGLDPLTGSVKNMPGNNKMVKESAKILLKEMVEFSSQTVDIQPAKTDLSAQGRNDIPGRESDWICPKCNFKNFARNIKCFRCDHISQEKLTKQREEVESIPLKKGDWICERCTFLNYAKNSRCWRCKEKPPKRELVGGEWECESCYYINFRRNMACLRCDHNRSRVNSESIQPASNNMSYWQPEPLFGDEKHSHEDGDSTSVFIRSENVTKDSIPGIRFHSLWIFVFWEVSVICLVMCRIKRWKRKMDLSRKNAKDMETDDDSKCLALKKVGILFIVLVMKKLQTGSRIRPERVSFENC